MSVPACRRTRRVGKETQVLELDFPAVERVQAHFLDGVALALSGLAASALAAAGLAGAALAASALCAAGLAGSAAQASVLPSASAPSKEVKEKAAILANIRKLLERPRP
jgi:hypothetical protein